MQWFYALNGERLGPVSPAQLANLVANGTVTNDTLVWREGFTDWVAWGTVAAENPLPAPAETVPEVPSVDADEASAEERGWSVDEFTLKLRENGYRVSMGGVLSRAWENYRSFFWLAFGIMAVALLLSMVVGFLPVVSILAAFLFTPQINAGTAWVFLKQARGEGVEFADMFAGFSRCFGKLAVLGLLQFVVIMVFAAVFGVALVVSGIPLDPEMTGGADPSPAAVMVFLGVLAVTIAVVTWLAVRFLLSHIVAIDRPEGAIDAFRLSWRITAGKFWMILVLLFLMSLLATAGMLALLIGLLFVLPIYPAIIAQLYHDACECAAGRPPE